MQKLFRRSHCCSLGVGVVAVSASPPISSLNNFSFSLLHNHHRKAIQMPSTAAAAAFRIVPAFGANNFRRPRSFSASVSPISKCLDENHRKLCGGGGGVSESRGFRLLKETQPNCSRNAWLGPVSQALIEEDASSKVETTQTGEIEKALVKVETQTGETEKALEEKKDSEEKVQVKLQRRQRGGGGSDEGATVAPENMDLLIVPGIGPRNLKKFVQKGIAGVAELKQLYKDKFIGKSSENMVDYLKSSVGIMHRTHAESITTYIKESVDEELKEQQSDVRQPPKKRITFCVEGNISVGKTTFLQRIANETLELQDLVEVVPEPVDKWQNVGPDHFNILDAFYTEPQRYAYTFQNYVFVTRVMQERESSSGIKPLRLMERSVFSDRMVFVRAVHEAKWMSEMEISIYDSWFDPVVTTLPGLIPDGFIYLRASPDTCHKRMLMRKREEEGGVSLDYLRDLHEKHESWLLPFERGNHGVLSVSELPDSASCPLGADIKDRVFYLEGNHMHSSIQKVPALVLDCEPNIDFSKDIEAKRHYAKQVAEFFAYVKKRNELLTPKVGAESGKQNPGQMILPHKGLWVPGGATPFPESALKSLDFKGAMPSFRA